MKKFEFNRRPIKKNFISKSSYAIKKFFGRKYVMIGAAALAVVIIVAAVLLIFGGNQKPKEAFAGAQKPAAVNSSGVQASSSPSGTADQPGAAPGITPSTTPGATPSPSEKPAPSQSAAPSETSAPQKPVKTTPSIDWKKVLKEYEVVDKKYYGGFSSNHYEYSDKELKMLAAVIYLEARGEPYNAQVAVGNVVMNRVLASGYPGKTIAEVVTRENQFAYSASTSPNRECMNVARDILDFEVWTVPQNTYYFRIAGSDGNWGGHKYYGKVGSTTFYTDSYSGRKNAKTIPAKLFDRVYKWPQFGCKPATRVRKIQKMLVALDYGKIYCDGYFGMDTKEALMKFQKSKKIHPDGIAGPSTIKALIKKYGIEKYLEL